MPPITGTPPVFSIIRDRVAQVRAPNGYRHLRDARSGKQKVSAILPRLGAAK